VGLWVGGRIEAKDLASYIISQVLGATFAAFILYIIVQGQAGFSGTGGFTTNGYGELSPNHFSLASAFLIEVVLTAVFLIIILLSTHSTGVAFFAETAALSQLWLFWVAPIIGAVIGAIIYKVVSNEKNKLYCNKKQPD
jgi:aquaporin Z